MKMTSPTILTPQQWTTLDRLRARMFGGRKKGTLGGSLIADMVALEKALTLCGSCKGKFDWRHHGYYSVWRYEHEPVIGQCDVCKMQITGNDGRLFIHEAQRPQAWATKDEQRDRWKTMRDVAITGRDRRRVR